LIGGKYPDCDTVIPKDRQLKFTGNAKEILLSIRRAGILTDDKQKCVIFDLKANEQSMVTAMSHDKGTYSGKLPIKSEVDIQAAFNVEFLAETLKMHGDRDVRIEAKSATAPWLFFFAGAEAGTFLLMPVKLSDALPAVAQK
jgi:DNA polymerase-3 subunit beta